MRLNHIGAGYCPSQAGGGQKNLGAMAHREIRADYAPETLAAEVKNRLDQFGWIIGFNTFYTHRVYLPTSQIRFFSASPAVWAERLQFAPPLQAMDKS